MIKRLGSQEQKKIKQENETLKQKLDSLIAILLDKKIISKEDAELLK